MAKTKLDKPPPVAVAILDTHWLIREAIACWLKDRGGYEVVWKGGSQAELGEALDAGLQVKLVLVAVAKDEDEGYLAVRWLRKEWPGLCCAAYAHRHDELTRLRVYRKGAQALLCEMVEQDAVLCALGTALAGGVFHTSLSQELMLANPDGLTMSERIREKRRQELTPKLWQVLMAVRKYPGHSTPKLGKHLGITARTVENHLDSLYVLFGVRSRTALVVRAFEIGLLTV